MSRWYNWQSPGTRETACPQAGALSPLAVGGYGANGRLLPARVPVLHRWFPFRLPQRIGEPARICRLGLRYRAWCRTPPNLSYGLKPNVCYIPAGGGAASSLYASHTQVFRRLRLGSVLAPTCP